MKPIRIEYTIREKRPHQAETAVTQIPVKVTVDDEKRVQEMTQILDRAASAYQRNRRHLLLKWRGVSSAAGSEWKTFR